MPQTSICRLCLCTDVRMFTIAGTPLQAVYEKITDSELLDNMKPVAACYICHAHLRRCRSFMEKSVRADEVLTGFLMNNKLTVKTVARIDRKSHNLVHSLSIKKMSSEDHLEVEESKVKTEVEFEFAGAEDVNDMSYEDHSDFPAFNDTEVQLDEKAFVLRPENEYLENVEYLKEEKQLIASDADENRNADSDDERPLNTLKSNLKCRSDDSDRTTTKRTVASVKKTLKKATVKKSQQKEKKRDVNTSPGKRYNCKHCDASFGRSYHLSRHLKIHSGDKPYHCDYCLAKFSTTYHLKRHVTIHTGEEGFKCGVCQRGFKRVDNLKSHIKNHGHVPMKEEVVGGSIERNENSSTTVKCEYVDENLKIDCHAKNIDDSKFECKVCHQCFSDKNGLEDHLKLHSRENETTKTILKRFLCNTCGARFSRNDHLKRHFRIHNRKSSSNKCSLCWSTFNDSEELRSHYRIHNVEEKYECDICKRRFTVKVNLEKHLARHFDKSNRQVKDNEPVVCNVCGIILNRKCSLKIHMLTHTGEKPHECHICHKSFSQRGSLKSHLKIHTGIKPFECTVCHHRFFAKNNLNTHMTKHKDDKPHECVFCHRRFKRKDVLAMHMKLHSGETPYECPICPRKFALKKSFKRHVIKHGSENTREKVY
ncbi:zinc finger protein 436 isoform X2 [Amyelois transitella]|uniref:zinc finger protein 436 isoform X2 n=1 Tax=Amyelois transitella TaxID=680683 RepID=UPI00067C75C7|nr:zinc finger protein 436 isoform X2 [Amyelois transitella]